LTRIRNTQTSKPHQSHWMGPMLCFLNNGFSHKFGKQFSFLLKILLLYATRLHILTLGLKKNDIFSLKIGPNRRK
jgi:hypothetical protein